MPAANTPDQLQPSEVDEAMDRLEALLHDKKLPAAGGDRWGVPSSEFTLLRRTSYNYDKSHTDIFKHVPSGSSLLVLVIRGEDPMLILPAVGVRDFSK